MTRQILIVEDEHVIRLDLEATLHKLGYQVLAGVGSAEKALAILQKSSPDLVLMDIHLSTAIDGIAAAAEIRKFSGVPIVFLTAHADIATLNRAYETQPFGYILKPFQEKDLQVAIEIACLRYEAEKNLRLAVQRERELRQLKSNFLSTAIHDIRNPLTVIGMAADLLEMSLHDTLTPRQADRFKKINHAGQLIRQLLDNVLELEHLESERLTFRPQSLDLVAWCVEFVEEVQLLSGDRCKIAFAWAGSPQHVVLDPILLQRIFGNLLSNAVKYSPPDSTVIFQLELTPELAVFAVRDRGIGIPLEMQCRLFQPFQRAENARKIAGTGLGLSIVKTCVDLCGGEIQLQSVPDEGTQVTVSLPIGLGVEQFGVI